MTELKNCSVLWDTESTELGKLGYWQNRAQLNQFGWGGISTRHHLVPSSPSSVNSVPSDTCGSVRRPLCGQTLLNQQKPITLLKSIYTQRYHIFSIFVATISGLWHLIISWQESSLDCWILTVLAKAIPCLLVTHTRNALRWWKEAGGLLMSWWTLSMCDLGYWAIYSWLPWAAVIDIHCTRLLPSVSYPSIYNLLYYWHVMSSLVYVKDIKGPWWQVIQAPAFTRIYRRAGQELASEDSVGEFWYHSKCCCMVVLFLSAVLTNFLG